MSKRLVLLDGNALLHRAWHALPPLTSPKGVVVNALYGVLMAVIKVVEQESPDAFIACWDLEGATFRHEAFEAYKAQREKKEDELYAQIPLIQEGLALLGVPSCMAEGFEADDDIGTLARRAEREGWEVSILTGDRDLLQLITPHVQVRLFRKGISETEEVTQENIKALFGLTPAQVIEYKILRGDASDNIPGIKGIGEKGAKELIDAYGTVDRIMKAAHDPASDMPNRQRAALLAEEDKLDGLRNLVTIRTDVPLECELKPTSLDRANEAFLTFLREYGFKSLLPRASGDVREPKKKPARMPSRARAEVGATNLITLHPATHEARTAEDVRVWLAAHPGDIACVLTPSGGMVPPDLWLGADKQQVLHVLSEAWHDKHVLSEALQARATQFVFHEAKRAFHEFARAGVQLDACGFDTQIAAYILEANIAEPTLDDLSMRYANAHSLVGAEGVAFLAEVGVILRARLKERAQEELYERFDKPLIPVLFRMERAGIRLDKEYLERLAKEFSHEQKRIEQEMASIVGETFNPASPLQLGRILFEVLKLPTTGIKRGKNGYSTAAEALEKLRGQHPLIELIESYREVAKLLSTYITPLPTMADHEDRVHTTFHQALASTGRLSSTDPNLQNIPIRTELGRKIRKAFVAKPGYVLVSCDYSQIELRVAAALADDKALKEVFLQGGDIHQSTAAAMWQIPLKDVTKEQRRAAKAVNFGVLYGQGAFGLSEAAGVTFAEAKEFIARYFHVYHRLHDYLEEVRQQAREQGCVETLFGRRRPLPELFSGMPAVRAAAERMAINMPIQGTAADAMKLAMIDLDAKLPTWSSTATMVLQVHDELVFEMKPEEVAILVPKIESAMEGAVDIGVPLKAEAKAGTNWEEMRELREK